MGGFNKVLMVVIIWLTLVGPVSAVVDEQGTLLTAMEGTVPVIRLTDLILDNMRFSIAKNPEVFLHQEGGRRVSLKELVSVGRIEKAKIFLKGGTVVKIVVLEMAQ